MIGIVGDVHGFIDLLIDYSKTAKEAEAVAMIQVGDFGVKQLELNNEYKANSIFPHLPTYIIGGNHEHFNQWEGFEEIKEVMHNLFYVQRGVILKIDGLNILFFGGASSIDKKWQGDAWDWREDIQPKDVERFERNLKYLEEKGEKVDIIITHVPPASVINKNFDSKGKLAFGVPLDWQDKSAPIIEEIWNRLDNPPLFCGHMHRRVKDGNCQILDINEMVFYPKYDVATVFDQKLLDEKKKRDDQLSALRAHRVEDMLYEGK